MLANSDLIGSIPDWLAGGGALIAVVIAGLAWRTAVEAYRVQQRSLTIQRAEVNSLLGDKRRQQADNLAAWVEERILEVHPAWRPPTPSSSSTRRVLVVQNSSSLPVFGVCIRLFWNHDEARDPAPILKTVVPPGRMEIEVDDEVSSRFATVSILFVDAGSSTWIRNSFGELYEIEASGRDQLLAEFQAPGLSPRFPEGSSGARQVQRIQESG